MGVYAPLETIQGHIADRHTGTLFRSCVIFCLPVLTAQRHVVENLAGAPLQAVEEFDRSNRRSACRSELCRSARQSRLASSSALPSGLTMMASSGSGSGVAEDAAGGTPVPGMASIADVAAA